MDPYGPEAADALAAWSKRALDMYAWRLDPEIDWTRYSCPTCGQILPSIVRVGDRYPVMRPDPYYLTHRPEGSKLSLFEMNRWGHHQKHNNPWHPKRGRPSYEDQRAPLRAVVFRGPGRTGTQMVINPNPKDIPPGSVILDDRRFHSHEDAGSFFMWLSFLRPHRNRLLARERQRRHRARRRGHGI
jgi:hypothetical protein